MHIAKFRRNVEDLLYIYTCSIMLAFPSSDATDIILHDTFAAW